MKLSAEQLAALSKILDAGMDLPRGEQQAWVDSLSDLDTKLKPALLRMLERGSDFDERGERDDFLQTPPKFTSSAFVTDELIGPYRRIRELGRGGMGAVWLAERVDGQLKRQVAIKLPHAIYSAQFLDRFRRERDILATLTHPNIAQIFDAGVMESDGHPYLVMEYVDGVPIDVFCEGLGIRERLQLFLPVCQAVWHAHEHLVIHRDLKPSNILVDRAGQPKLLDFGIAKLLDQISDATHTSERLMTPGYASPEQIQGGVQTTRTDVYSLGAVLYKLLAGRSPHLSDSGTSQAIEIASGKAVIPDASRLNPSLPQDLDYILRKALRREPDERYVSPEALALDIRAFLDSKPVDARSGDVRYRARKVVRRYWASIAAVAAVIASLATGLYLTNRQRAIAQQSFSEVRQLAHSFVYEVYDDVAKLQGSTKTREMMVRTGLEYLARLGENAGGDLGLQKEIAEAYVKIGLAQGSPTDPSLGRTSEAIASFEKALGIFRRIAAKDTAYLPDLAMHYTNYGNLLRLTGHFKEARGFSHSALETFDRLQSTQSLNRKTEPAYIKAWCIEGDIDEDMGDFQQAWTEFSRCSELAKAYASRYPETANVYLASQAAERKATAAQELGNLSGALQALAEDESLLRGLLAKEPRNPRFRRAEALLYQFRSIVYFDDRKPNLHDPSRALENAKLYLKATEEMAGSDAEDRSSKRSHAIAMYRVSLTLRQFEPEAAVKMAGNAVRLFDQLIAAGNNDSITRSNRLAALARLAGAQISARHFADARNSAESAIAVARSLITGQSPNEDRDLIAALMVAGNANAGAGEFERAGSQLHEARQRAQTLLKPGDLMSVIPLAYTEMALGDYYEAQHRNPEARACYQAVAALWRDSVPSSEYALQMRATADRVLSSARR